MESPNCSFKFSIRRRKFIHRGIFGDHLMGFFFEESEIGLAHDRGIGIIHLAEEHIPPDGLVLFP